MHLETGLSQKERRPSVDAVPVSAPMTPSERRPRSRAPRLGESGKRQTLNVFTVDGRDVSAEVGSEEAVVDETAFVKQPSVIFTRGKKGMYYTLLLLDYRKDEGSAPHHRLHWLITDIPGQDFSSGDLSDGIVLADFEAPREPRLCRPSVYVLMVFEQRPSAAAAAPLGLHPDLQLHSGQRASFPLTTWLRCNSPKMARIAACQQFKAYLSQDCVHLGRQEDTLDTRDDQGVLGDVDSEPSADERPSRPSCEDKENQRTPTTKSKRGKLSRLRRLLRKHRSPV